MEKKIILITGATDGIGKEAVKILAKEGHKIILQGRNPEKIQKVMEEIKAENKDADLDSAIADLLSFKQIKIMCDELLKKYDHLDVLVNNAGAVFDVQRKLTEDGEERTFQLNVYAPFLLSHLLLPIIKKSKSGRIVFEGSAAHRAARQPDLDDMKCEKEYGGQGNYNLSKLYLIWLMRHFDKYLKKRGINNVTSNATHPGMVGTNFGHNADKGFLVNMIYKIGWYFSDTIDKGALSEVFLATSPTVEGVSGKFYSNKCEEEQPKEKYYTEENEKKLWDYCVQICKPYVSVEE